MKTTKMLELEIKTGKDIREILQELYQKNGNGVGVANSLGITRPTLGYWLKALGLEQRVVLVEKEAN